MYAKKKVCEKLCKDWTSSKVWKRIVKRRGMWERIYEKEGPWLHNKDEQKITSLFKGTRFESIEQQRRIKARDKDERGLKDWTTKEGVVSERKIRQVQNDYTKWTKNGTCGIHNFIFSKKIIQMFNVLHY